MELSNAENRRLTLLLTCTSDPHELHDILDILADPSPPTRLALDKSPHTLRQLN
jgi:hypothetical protein